MGLGRARGLSEATLERLLESRAAEGPFLSLPDFLERTAARRDETETLIRVGAFDAFDRTRPELLLTHTLTSGHVQVPCSQTFCPTHPESSWQGSPVWPGERVHVLVSVSQ